MVILGIETSCDETAAAVVEDGKRILSNIVSSQIELHRQFGGIVPEVASRSHVEKIIPIIKQALIEAKMKLEDLDGIAVTFGPGLLGSLLVGLTVAKGISYGLRVPLIGINHLEAHLYANFLSYPHLRPPFVGLVISGGHTELIFLSGKGNYQVLGATRDDAVGEAFDKVAKILNLGYPGGPIIERVAREGRPHSIPLPSIRFKEDTFDFSFSGIKTAVLYYVMDLEKEGASIPTADLAASFQAKVAEVLAERVFRAASLKKVKKIVLGGGVSSNLFLRSFIQKEKPKDLKIFFPPPSLCTDNAAMIAACAYPKIREGLISSPSLDVQPNLSF